MEIIQSLQHDQNGMFIITIKNLKSHNQLLALVNVIYNGECMVCHEFYVGKCGEGWSHPKIQVVRTGLGAQSRIIEKLFQFLLI